MSRRLLSILPLLCACAAERDPASLFGPTQEGTLVVDAQLIVDAPLPPVYLSLTQALGHIYTTAAVKGARIAISGNGRTFDYAEDPESPGSYLPSGLAAPVAPETTYELAIATADDRRLRAQTSTPGRLRVVELLLLDGETLTPQRRLKLFAELGDAVYKAPENRIVYQLGLIEAILEEELDIPAYQLAIFNLEEDSPLLIDADFVEEDDLEQFERQGASPPLSVRDGRARLPWFAVAFAGRHKFKIYAVDENWFDFIRTDPEEGGGGFGGLLGDQFQRPVFNIEGGIGLFASAAVDSVGFTVVPAAD